MRCKSQLGAKFPTFCAQKDAAHKTRVLQSRYRGEESELGSKLCTFLVPTLSWLNFSKLSDYREIFKIDFAESQERSDNFCTLGQKNLVTQADIWALNKPGRKFTLNNPSRKFTEPIYSFLFLVDWDTITLIPFFQDDDVFWNGDLLKSKTSKY